MSAIIKQLKNWFTEQNIYPQTVEKAIYDSNGKRLDNKLANGVANPNLLINADFRNPVNQRGITTPTISSYFIDRWKCWNLTGISISATDSFIKIVRTSSDATTGGIDQQIEFPSQYLGKTMTVSIRYKADVGFVGSFYDYRYDGNSHTDFSKTFTADNKWHTDSVTFTLGDSASIFVIGIAVENSELNKSVCIEWIKLEEGNIATPFKPRLYAEELALCQRYYQKYTNKLIFSPYVLYDDAHWYDDFVLPVPMRVVPTAKITTGDNYNFKTLTADVQSAKCLMNMLCDKAGATAHTWYHLELDAEL